MSPEKIKEVLDAHQKWLNDEEGGVRANLCRANLSDADLRRANLRRADLRRANLRGADLCRANLSCADLRRANLSCANLCRADLCCADLSDADLSGANLRRADLIGANLCRANLSDADLRRANLRGADLIGANLDFSCLPLWCGGSRFKCDKKLVRQLFAHIMTLEVEEESDDMKAARAAIRGEALKSHRANDLGLEEE